MNRLRRRLGSRWLPEPAEPGVDEPAEPKAGEPVEPAEPATEAPEPAEPAGTRGGGARRSPIAVAVRARPGE